MLEELKKRVYEANMLLPEYHLITFTWGNVSEIDRETGIFGIKPSGVLYEELTPEKIVLVDVKTGKKVEGDLNPSSDTETHLAIYRNFEGVGGVVHTHSNYATAYAQAGRDIPCYGTTHADYFYGAVPCGRDLTEEELVNYEESIGKVIVETFRERNIDYREMFAALDKNHGPFVWGKDGVEAVHGAVVLEECARIAYLTEMLNPGVGPAPQKLIDKHFTRKHGPNAYYGQTK